MRRHNTWLTTVILLMIVPSLVAQVAPEGQSRRARDTNEHVLHPWALTELIDELGGRSVTLQKARVLVVVNPQVLLIETASALPPLPRHLDRVLVMIDKGTLNVPASDIEDRSVKVLGVARTLLGIQTTREVPWPPELTREVVKRYEIRAAVLANSVQTADGVELTSRRP